ncbi:Lipase OS=Rhizopus oryzae PE=1 SV=1 [Rhizoctonia solani AG-1 IB]|uniref:Lipase n=1 Tax=Thanatephorus cucumeris (strain AG1-IB / isolate 7/3/14) TaxID=1108050 RepID=A0A0B7FRF8_THACB|nr:Lipase OS=Rhizopus oryzae PE=1 SV=1 [Rhizoctonia solani AG-1 IB]
MLASFAAAFLLGVASTLALPAPVPRAGVTALTAAQVKTYEPYALLSRVGYCPASKTATWSCGASCSALPGMVVYASGGDGVVTPYWFVGYYPALNSVVISNQGTDASKFVPILIDADFRLDQLDTKFFPGLCRAHARDLRRYVTPTGFQEAQKRGASAKLAAVKKAISERGTSLVTLTGHSLGGAISLIDALYLSINLPSAKLKVVTHGMPRVGNSEFAALVDSKIADISRIVNEKDIVPIIPGRGLGFQHVSGEKHIVSPGNWVTCSGRDNTDAKCSIGTVPNILVGDVNDHGGPYEGISIGSSGCN